MTQFTSTPTVQTMAKTPPAAKKPFRADIQGLRTIAVLAVIADHMLGYPHGGFVGVDIFFVLSGFLITGLLIREYDREGRISFGDFYRRRVRRIIPLAAMVIALTVMASWLLYTTGRAQRITEDGVWAMLFGMNWNLALEGTDYMQAGGAVTPLQHYWSLAVEEQFYVVWPWVIILLLGVVPSVLKRAQGSKVLLGIGMLTLTALSLGWAMWETATSPTFAYFSTFSRAWELGVGALIAVTATQLGRIPNVLRPVLAYMGLAGILWSIFFITSEMPFPGPWAVVPVLSTALVIAAGTGGEQRFLAPITNGGVRYLGDISYSLYLWHFPVIILLGDYMGLDSVLDYALTLSLIFLLSVGSYHFLEDPIRKSEWLEPKRGRKKDRVALNARFGQVGVGALAAVTIIVTGAALVQDNRPYVLKTDEDKRAVAFLAQSAPQGDVRAAEQVAALTPEEALGAEIAAALQADTWPELSPSIDELGSASFAEEWVKGGCLVEADKSMEEAKDAASRCSFGDPSAEKTALILGDSTAVSYVPGIRAALEPQGYKVVVNTRQQCPAIHAPVLRTGDVEYPECDEYRDWVESQLPILKPDLVLISSSYFLKFASWTDENADRAAEWTDATTAAIDAIAPSAGSIAFLDPFPSSKHLEECATRSGNPDECETRVSDGHKELQAATAAAVKDAAGRANVSHIDTMRWFCNAEGYCPGFVGNTPVRGDGGHITDAYSERLAPALAERLLATPAS